MEAGATRLHGAALGIGERVGNTPIDALLTNLVLMGYRQTDLTRLGRVLRARVRGLRRADSAELPGRGPGRVPHRHRRPRRGRDQGDQKARRVARRRGLLGVPASLVGRAQAIEIGPLSGRSNVVFWLESRGMEATDELVDRIFTKAKSSSSVLTEAEVRAAAGERPGRSE